MGVAQCPGEGIRRGQEACKGKGHSKENFRSWWADTGWHSGCGGLAAHRCVWLRGGPQPPSDLHGPLPVEVEQEEESVLCTVGWQGPRDGDQPKGCIPRRPPRHQAHQQRPTQSFPARSWDEEPQSRVQSWPCPWLHRVETPADSSPFGTQFLSVGKAGAPWWWSQLRDLPQGLASSLDRAGAARPPPSSFPGWSSLKEEVGKQEEDNDSLGPHGQLMPRI